MTEPAAKKDDKIISNGTSKVWVQPPGSPPPNPITVDFSYEGPIDDICSSNVFVMGKPAATVGSKATNSFPPDKQLKVINEGAIKTTEIDNTTTITIGSSTVYINGKKAARNEDTAKTWDYSTPSTPALSPPGIPKEVENAKVKATGSVFIGG